MSFDFYLVGNEGFFFLRFTPKNALHQKAKFNSLLPDSFVVMVATVSNPPITSIFFKTPFFSEEGFSKYMVGVVGFFFLRFTPKNALHQKAKFNWLLPDSFVVRVATVSNPPITSIFFKTPFFSEEGFSKYMVGHLGTPPNLGETQSGNDQIWILASKSSRNLCYDFFTFI